MTGSRDSGRTPELWMKTMACAAALILTTIARGPAHAADKPLSACPLLTPAEIATATGETAGQPHEDSIVISEGPTKGQTMAMCNWPTGTQSNVGVAVTRGLAGAQREAGLAQFGKAFQTLKSQGW